MKRESLLAIMITTVGWIIIMLYLLPFIWMVGTSFKPIGEWGVPILLSQNPTLRNYAEVLITGGIYGVRGHFPPIIKYLINSLIVSICVAFLTSFLGAMTGYAILRHRVGGTGFANWILSLRMIPPVVVLYPLVVMTKTLALHDTLGGLILVYPLITIPIATWFMIGAFKSVPKETEEAALLDGCSEFQVFYKIALPQATTGLATTFIFTFLFSWSEFLIPLLLAPSERAMPLTVFAAYFSNQYGILWGPLSAAGVIISIPVIMLAVFIRKFIVRGLTMGFVR
ncbi:MAG: carbohydrate ABC transporter permease [Aigarchaeota archaeon]|nr:carbohydrate ABC transporter permease [Aigarchaeota archaeon]